VLWLSADRGVFWYVHQVLQPRQRATRTNMEWSFGICIAWCRSRNVSRPMGRTSTQCWKLRPKPSCGRADNPKKETQKRDVPRCVPFSSFNDDLDYQLSAHSPCQGVRLEAGCKTRKRRSKRPRSSPPPFVRQVTKPSKPSAETLVNRVVASSQCLVTWLGFGDQTLNPVLPAASKQSK
jgi:hypothetical protein